MVIMDMSNFAKKKCEGLILIMLKLHRYMFMNIDCPLKRSLRVQTFLTTFLLHEH